MLLLIIELIIFDRDVRDIVISLILDKCEGYAEILTELWEVTPCIGTNMKFSFLKITESASDGTSWCM